MGSLLYWTVAMSLGGLSLALLGDSGADELELEPTTQPLPASEEPIMVHLQKWQGQGPPPGPGLADDARASSGGNGATGDDLSVTEGQDNGQGTDGTGRLPATDDPPPPPASDPAAPTSL
jgi:hypothetical protein